MKDLEYFKKNFKIRKYRKNFKIKKYRKNFKIKNRILFIYNSNNKKYLFSNFNTFFKIDDKFSKISWDNLYNIDKILEVLENEDNNRRT